MDFTDQDFYNQFITDLQTAGDAVENHGYELNGYNVHGFEDNDLEALGDTPKAAVDGFLSHVHDAYSVGASLEPTTFADLFEQKSGDYIEKAVDNMLWQIQGRIFIKEPGIDDLDHAAHYFHLEAHPQLDETVFHLHYARTDAEPYVDEFLDILKDEDLNAQQKPKYHNFRS
ncbi:hypothetical protein ACFQO4_03045 [Saliphagus sp. GCM10025334]